MAYKLVDEELQIYSCSLADLTLKQTAVILRQWEKDANIGELAVFYNPITGKLVLNRDNENYEIWLELTRCYMKAPDKARENVLKENYHQKVKETLEAINECVKDRRIRQEIKRIYKHSIPNKYEDVLEQLYKEESGCFGQSLAFIYGMMCGKREERARKKKHKGTP